nr:hypothetical protein [Tanacetum cinerariifolium]
ERLLLGGYAMQTGDFG